jgi:hypothetical protein
VEAPKPKDTPSVISDVTGATEHTSGTGSSGGTSTGAPPPSQAPVRNSAPDPAYDAFAVLGLKTAKVKDYCHAKKIRWPTVRNGVPFCASYHIKHMCNTRCGAAADHNVQSPPEVERMVAWCTKTTRSPEVAAGATAGPPCPL